jgi:hypothetical protein
MKIDKNIYIKQYGIKAYKEFCKQNRVITGMNTGTRVMKTAKVYSRKRKHKNKWD